ncbi:MAG: FkbM family methyltransferase [Rhizobiaceae bacterium]|nr:FkbM family methyltransferase [Rhizobiaceae bacterium]MCV0408606.1 FkbM family methyltransferase [Rhizobiaceae bacterium]
MAGRLKSLERGLRGSRDRLLRWLFSGRRGHKLVLDALSHDITAITMDCGDHVISFSPKELVGRHLYVKGHFDRDRVEALLGMLEGAGRIPAGGATVLDIGANIGTQSVYFAKSGKVARVLAIEPDPRNLALLRRNVAENRLEAIVTVIPLAIADFEGTAQLFRKAGNHGESSLLPGAHDETPVDIVVRPLGPVLADAGIAEDAVDLVWMDIEGAEPMACRSMEALLSRGVPLMMEFSPALYGENESREFVAFLAGFYGRAIVFDRAGHREIAPAEIPLTGRQFDVLLIGQAATAQPIIPANLSSVDSMAMSPVP